MCQSSPKLSATPPFCKMSVTNRSLSAASQGDISTLEELRRKVDLKGCCDKYGATPVHYATRTGQLHCMKWLVETAGLSGTRPAHNGATPAHDAAATGKLECLQWLIEHGGSSATGRDACGATPLHLAARFGHLNVVAWLVDAKKCSAMDRAQNGVTPVHLAAAKGSINCLKWLSQSHSRSVNERADNGTTPVYFAAQEGKLDCLQFLAAEADADLQLRANDGMLPVHAAAQTGHLDCLSWMIENAGASMTERDNDGATPMHFAAARGRVNILQWLLSHGCSAGRDDLGGTPLHDAAEHGQLEALEVLVACGMDTGVRDMDGLTPADLADECGHRDCAQFLRSPLQIRSVQLNAEDYLKPLERDNQVLDHRAISQTSNPNNPALPPGGSTNVNKHDACLLSEVRTFEPDSLKAAPQKKKNLQDVKLGNITSKDPDHEGVSAKKDQQQLAIPNWKASLMKKRAKQMESDKSKELPSTVEKTKSDVPAWKRDILINKKIQRSDRAEKIAQQRLLTTEEQKKAKFDSLPEWKKKLILQKQSKLT